MRSWLFPWVHLIQGASYISLCATDFVLYWDDYRTAARQGTSRTHKTMEWEYTMRALDLELKSQVISVGVEFVIILNLLRLKHWLFLCLTHWISCCFFIFLRVQHWCLWCRCACLCGWGLRRRNEVRHVLVESGHRVSWHTAPRHNTMWVRVNEVIEVPVMVTHGALQTNSKMQKVNYWLFQNNILM